MGWSESERNPIEEHGIWPINNIIQRTSWEFETHEHRNMHNIHGIQISNAYWSCSQNAPQMNLEKSLID